MDPQKALEIIRSLAEGVDPETGEVFPEGSPYQRAETVRALMLAATALQSTVRVAERSKVLPGNSGKGWGTEEERLLLERFDAGVSETELAKLHQRTKGGIRARLMRLGRIDGSAQD